VKNVIAEIVSLSGYESRVSALLDEEGMAMEFFIACSPESHRSFRAPVAFEKPAGPGEARGRAAAFESFISSSPNRDGSIWLEFTPSRERTLSAADQNVLEKLAAQIKKAVKRGR
jgi:hypothetical protein